MGRTLEWIFNGETRCDGFDRTSMKTRILPAASKYKKARDEVLREKVARLQADWQKEWIYKTKNEQSCY